jgi:hypothetical protein
LTSLAAFNNTSPWLPGSSLATWIIAISILVSTILSVLAFLGLAQGLQIRIWKGQIEARLRLLERYRNDVREEARRRLEEMGAKDVNEILDTVMEYFVIEPVSIEPTDIIRRMENLLRTEEERIEQIVLRKIPSEKRGDPEVKNVITLLAIANALHTIYKLVRHILLTGIKTKNALLVAQLWMILPQIMRIAKAYHSAARIVSKGAPIGDSAGPLAAYRLMRMFERLEGPTEIEKDTVYSVHRFEGRTVVIVKAKGPGSTVGKPGEAVRRLVEEKISGRVAAIITVDAALKMEGEPTGSIAEGVGVAMGDPGPEKIKIERVAVSHGIPLYAIAIKMGLEEAITAMKKEIVNGVNAAIERAKKIIVETTKPGDTVILVGVGNTIGVAQ